MNFEDNKGPIFFGLDSLDKKLCNYLNFNDGFFVELGANDGITQSNSYHFEKFKNWNGILIEPVPQNYLHCLTVRSSNTLVFPYACVGFDFKDKYVEIMYSNLMSTPLGLETDVSDPIKHASEGKKYLDSTETNFSFGAIAKNLNDILVEASAPLRINLLSLDVEGAEIEVLKGVDHSKFRFDYICIECRDIMKMTEYMKKNNYKMVEKLSHHDYLFKDINSVI